MHWKVAVLGIAPCSDMLAKTRHKSELWYVNSLRMLNKMSDFFL